MEATFTSLCFGPRLVFFPLCVPQESSIGQVWWFPQVWTDAQEAMEQNFGQSLVVRTGGIPGIERIRKVFL